MIARHEGQVLLVAGGIPGERVAARVERVEKRLAFAVAGDVIESSPDRRAASFDPACGGCSYAHIASPRQRVLKGEIIADAFARIGRHPLPGPVAVAGSPESGYRMRARLHVQGRRAGFYLEGTHRLCDAAATAQMLPETTAAIAAALEALGEAADAVAAVEVIENVAGDERALHLEMRGAAAIPAASLAAAVAAGGLTGCSARTETGAFSKSGDPAVGDPLPVLTGGRAASGVLRRQAVSFFQGNRHLLPALVGFVMDAVPAERQVLDLYAGVGLFAVSLAAAGREGIVAVEGDREGGADLLRNAAPWPAGIHARVAMVEDHLRRDRSRPGTVIVDPPRVGLSRDVLDALPRLGAGRILYVSCDPPTMARDARHLLDAGYRLESVTGFDLFPNTPHVESVALFQGDTHL